MDDARWEVLVARHLAGDLDDQEKQELATYAQSSPEAARAVAQQILLHRSLVQAGRPPMDVSRFMASLSTPQRASVDEVMRTIQSLPLLSRRRRVVTWGVVTTLAAAAAVVLVLGARTGRERDAGERAASDVARPPEAPAPSPRRPHPSDPSHTPRLERVGGLVYVMANANRSPAVVGRLLVGGEGLLTVGKSSSAVVSYPDGTRLDVAGDSVIAQFSAGGEGGPLAKSVFVARGDVRGHVAAQPVGAPMSFVSPHVEAVVLGTRLTMAVTSEATRVDVHEGRLRVRGGRAGDSVDVVAGRYALIRDGEPPALADKPSIGLALFVAGATEEMLNPSDLAVRERLQATGFEVRVLASNAPSLLSDAQGATLIVVSSTASATDVDARLGQVPAPILTWESYLYDDLGMTGSCEQGDCGVEAGRHGLIMKDAGHPLAAGLVGHVEASRHGSVVSWGSPSVTAAWVATLAGNPTKALIFGYERGAAMPGLASAPARRVGFFMGDDTARGLTEAGWALFDAAVAWCTARAVGP